MKLENKEFIPIEPEINGYQYPTEPLSEGEIPFSSKSAKAEITDDDVYQLRKWKNSVIEMRDKYKGKFLYNVFDDEAKRIVIFLSKHTDKF
jgi:hypothetical protein